MAAFEQSAAASRWVVSADVPALDGADAAAAPAGDSIDAQARGEAHYRAGDYAAAAEIFARLRAAARHAEAAAQFRASAQLLPDDPAPFLNLSAALLALGEHRKALEAAR